jgi:hypothetical protein
VNVTTMRAKDVETGGSAGVGGGHEGGFALILALLAMLILTFLGLTLAATTSTELQIATNYRWSQQALYNAEAGLEAGKVVLRTVGTLTPVMPPARGFTWQANLVAPPALPASAPWTGNDAQGIPARNWENAGCDNLTGEGFGAVLSDNGTGLCAGGCQNISTFLGSQLNGAFTIWVRRDIQTLTTGGSAGQLQDDQTTPPTVVVMTAEGTAPYMGGGLTSQLAVSNRATQYLQVAVAEVTNLGNTSVCSKSTGQVGSGSTGAGFNACAAVNSTAVAGLGGNGSNANTTNK